MKPEPAATRPLLNPTEQWWASEALPRHQSAARLLQTEALGGRYQQSVYELFSEMEEKDGHLYAVIQTRINGLLSLTQRIVPSAGHEESDERIYPFVKTQWEAFPRRAEFLKALLDGVSKGFAVVELIWDYDADGHLVVKDWVAHPQEWFGFRPDGELLLHSPPFPAQKNTQDHPFAYSDPGRSTSVASSVYTAPQRKFIVFRFGSDFRNPYGRGLCQRAYWYYWFKKNTVKFWAVFNEKFGSPTAVARYGPGTTAEDRQSLMDMLSALQSDAGIVLPESIQLEFLDGGRSGNGDSFREFLDWCNDEMSKICLGGTLTSGEGRRSGSMALGTVHDLVRRDYIEADAALLQSTVNETLMKWLCELNFGQDAPQPRLQIETDAPVDLEKRLSVDRDLLGIGVSLPENYFYTTYGRPMPSEGDATLRFDDSNFFKYHLQYGILTINEVRTRLGLEPVSWGDKRAGQDVIDQDNEASAEDAGRSPI